MLMNCIFMALRELRTNVLRTSLTALGMVIGVAAVITVVALMQGVSAQIVSDTQVLLGNLVVVQPKRAPEQDYIEPFRAADAAAIRASVAGAVAVAPAAVDYINVSANGRERQAPVIGTTADMFTVRNWSVGLGRIFTAAEVSAGRPVCLLGQSTAAALFGQQNPVGTALRSGSFSCDIIGVISGARSTSADSDADDMVVMPLLAYQRRLAGNDGVDLILVTAYTIEQVTTVIRSITLLLRERRGIAAGRHDTFSVSDIRDQIRRVQRLIHRLGLMVAGVAAISLVVGGIGIMNVMLVTVTERTREIGIRLAVGAQESDVLIQFLVEAVIFALAGGIVGVVLGMVAALVIGSMIGAPALLSVEVVALGFGIPTLVGLAFGVVPAIRASRLDPIDALRHE